ncbi:hypothetical protein T05_277 [Trichinella murrelli]|uniref:Uncharacterized protein n=1 Tax=Trichinella murrelli TaxID=144512 RepID=A0A0V0TMX8_9BILA|nr:hypothetical protein T05_277 [Trichinella murrelli]
MNFLCKVSIILLPTFRCSGQEWTVFHLAGIQFRLRRNELITLIDMNSHSVTVAPGLHIDDSCHLSFINQNSIIYIHASKELSDVGHLLKQLDNLRIQLAEFFCEDLHSFKLDEAFKVIG